jgi:hypothetical protein
MPITIKLEQCLTWSCPFMYLTPIIHSVHCRTLSEKALYDMIFFSEIDFFENNCIDNQQITI